MRKALLVFVLIFVLAPSLFSQTTGTAWVRRYNGPGNGNDYPSGLAVDGSWNVCVTGTSIGSGNDYDYVTIKYYPNGDTAWIRRYNGPGNADDSAIAIAVDGSGNIYVTGKSYGNGTNYDYATVKYYPNGDTGWVRRYNGPGNGNDYPSGLALDGSGNAYVIGNSPDGCHAIKYLPNGDIAWVRTLGLQTATGVGEARHIALDDFDNVYVTGFYKFDGIDYDLVMIKYLPDGDTAWVRRYDGPGNGNDYPSGLVIDGSENVCVTGRSIGTGSDFDYVTLKYYPDGDTAWTRRYNGPGNAVDSAIGIAADGSGDIYVTGKSYGSGTNYDYATIKYYPNGDTAWVRRFNGPENDDDRPAGITVDDSGKVYVTGTTGYGTGLDDFATIAYHPEGDTAWLRSYNGPGNGPDRSIAITTDDSTNVYLAGMSQGNGTGYDFVVLKYQLFKLRSDTLWFIAYSPVNLIVTAPNQDSIGVGFNTILQGSTYDSTSDLDGDGDKDDRVTIPGPVIGQYLVSVVADSAGGAGNYTLAVKIDGNEDKPLATSSAVPGPGEIDSLFYPVTEFLRGDPNRDTRKNVTDLIYLINYVLNQGPAPEPLFLGDLNCDGEINIVDLIYLIDYLFRNGNAPCS